MQPHNPASRINFCNWFLQSVHDSEVALIWLSFLMKHGFICTDTFPPKIISTGVLLIHVFLSSWRKSWCVVHSECVHVQGYNFWQLLQHRYDDFIVFMEQYLNHIGKIL
jgi:hypothetical protein